MRKLPVVVGGAALLGIGALLASGTPTRAQQAGPRPAAPDSIVATRLGADSGALRGPRQPILFRHDLHAGQFKMQCQYCHYSVNVSSEPGIPSVETCMGCHLYIPGTDSTNRAEIRKLVTAWNEKKPIEWVRVHSLARHAHFPHQRHVKAMGANACATCHGDVTRMPQVYKVNNVNNMGWCISCHVERQVSRDCTVCHY